MVGFGSFHDNTFVRLVTINGENSEKDILNFFKILEKFTEQNSDLIKRI
jgi:sulfinoalanine decarboxylase/sulfinoalanine decarboxylase/aspartate 1-decarboxylase